MTAPLAASSAPLGTCHCGGRFHVYWTKIISALSRARYYRCRRCGHRPENNKLIVPLELAPPRPFLRAS